jgi:hypothetical protein
VIIWISEAKVIPKRHIKLGKQINGRFNDISSTDEKK